MAARSRLLGIRLLAPVSLSLFAALLPLRGNLCAVAQQPFNQQVGEQDWPQLGASPSRNNVADAHSVPTDWDIKSGHNIKWSMPLGSQTYGNPVIANGKVYVGTNNYSSYLDRYPITVDLGVLLCFHESNGTFLWQHSSEKLPQGRVHDWPQQGICSAPVAEGDRLWFVTSRGEVMCLDSEGFYDGEDDGPELGVWHQPFAILADFSSFTEGHVRKGIWGEFNSTISPLLEASAIVNRVMPSSYRRADNPNEWIGSVSAHQGPSTVETLRLAFSDVTLAITTIGESSGKTITVDLGLFSALDKGEILPLLEENLRTRGIVLSETASPLVQERGKRWTLHAHHRNNPVELLLERRGSSLVCRQKVDRPSSKEADVVWSVDMMNELGVRQHNMATCAPTIWGNVLFVITSNGVDEGHFEIPAPEAPSFMALDKRTGTVIWTDNSPGNNILHGQWSCPAVGILGGVPQVIFPGGDGWVYSFRADRWENGRPELLWKFDGNPKDARWQLGGSGTRNEIIAYPVIHNGAVYVAMGQDPEHGQGPGHLWCIDPTKRGDVSPELVVDKSGNMVPHRSHLAHDPWEYLFAMHVEKEHGEQIKQQRMPVPLREQLQQHKAVLTNPVELTPGLFKSEWMFQAERDGRECQMKVERRWLRERHVYELRVAVRTGESVIPNPHSALIWHYSGSDSNQDGEIGFEEEMHRTLGSPVITRGFLFIVDGAGLVHFLDASTGKPFGTWDLLAACWATPTVAGDHLYVVDEDGEVTVFSIPPDEGEALRIAPPAEGGNFKPQRTIDMGNSIYTTPAVGNGVLYIASRNRLYAISEGADRPKDVEK